MLSFSSVGIAESVVSEKTVATENTKTEVSVETRSEPEFQEEEFEELEEYKDPIAPFNKFVFGFNKVLDGLIIRPTTMVYKYIIPPFVRTGVHNVLGNLNEPVNFANALFQFEGKKAGHTLARFLLNTIFGFGGLFDIASEVGIKEEKNDFGITLSKWGFGEGFYLVLPVFGPSNFRDAIGKVADYFLDPLNYYVYFTDRYYIGYARAGATLIDTRFNLLDITDTLDKSEDPYTNYRITFTDNRRYITREHEESETEGEVPFEEELEEDDA